MHIIIRNTIASAALAASLFATAAIAEAGTLRLGMTTWVGYGPMFLARNKGFFKAVEFIKTNPDEANAIMAKGVGGYLEKPEDFPGAAEGVRYYDHARNIEFFGTAEKGEAADLIKLGNEIWCGFEKLKMDVNYGNLVDLRFVDPK